MLYQTFFSEPKDGGYKVQKVFKDELKPGMILGKTIVSADSHILILERGAILNQKKIKALQKYNLNQIFIIGRANLSEKELDNIDESINGVVDEAEKEAKQKREAFDRVAFLNTLLEAKKIKVEGSFSEEAAVISNEDHVKGLVFLKTFEVDVEELITPFNQTHKALFKNTKKAFESIRSGGAFSKEDIQEPVSHAITDIKKSDNIMARLSVMEQKDNYTFDHSLRVFLLATSLGKWLGYTEKDLENLSTAALLFDIGKMKIPEFIMNREQKLGSKEFDMIRKHAEFSYNILKEENTYEEDTLQGVLLHHERMDGSGYPFGLKGNKIHEFARIIGICDTFDALTSERSYAEKKTPFEAVEEMQKMSEKLFDFQMTYLFLNKITGYYLGNKVLLENGEQGEIIYIHPKYPTKPVVKTKNKIFDLKKEDLRILEMKYFGDVLAEKDK